MFDSPRTAPIPPGFSRPAAVTAHEESDITEQAHEDRGLPPSPQSAGAGEIEDERHIDVCDYCRSVQKQARSRSRTRHRHGPRCRHHRERSGQSDGEEEAVEALRGRIAGSREAAATSRPSEARSRNLVAVGHNTASGTATPRNNSSLPPYVSNPPSESVHDDVRQPELSRSRSQTLRTDAGPRVPEATLAFVRDQQRRQLAQQRRAVAVPNTDTSTDEDAGLPLSRVPPVADPLRVHFVPSRTSATADSSALQSTPHGKPAVTYSDKAAQAHESAQSIVAQMRLQQRDERLSTLLDDCVRDDQQVSATSVFRRVSERPGHASDPTTHIKKPHRRPSSLIDSVLGFDEVNPQDLIYGEGSKVDGGFAFALPDDCREGSILLDSEATPAKEISQSSTTPSNFSSTLASYFRRNTDAHRSSGKKANSQEERSHSARHAAAIRQPSRDSIESSSSSHSSFRSDLQRPASLSQRVDRSNSRPCQLKLFQGRQRDARGPSKLRESTTGSDGEGSNEDEERWEDVRLRPQTATGKNSRLAEAVGVEQRPASASSAYDPRRPRALSAIREERESVATFIEKHRHRASSLTDRASPTKRKTNDTLPRDSGASARMGMSEADIVALCLMQGMVPPGLPRDDTLVTWSGPLSPTNPRNWPAFHKWYACIFVALATFLANAGTNMVAPALGLISDSYHEVYIPSYRGFLIGSYVSAFAVAPLIYGPFSELLGRKPVLVFGTTLFWIANLLSAYVDASWELMILRFLAALGASAPMAIGGAVLTDIFQPHERGRAMTVFALAPQLGPVLGPIMGGWVSQETRDWRLIFWVAAGAGIFVAFFMLFMRESYTPRILARRAKRLRKKTGNPALTTIFERRRETVRQVLTRGMIRPLVLFCCEPIVQLLCVYVSLIYGIMHLVTATFPAVFGTIYGEYPGWASMHFIAIGVGTIAGGILGGHLIERNYRRLSARNKGVGKPEYKIYSFLWTVWLPPLGLFTYGLVTYYGVHWIFADAGIVLFCLGISMAIVAIQSYIVDCYALLAGSALTSTIVIRSMVGTGATIAAEDVLLEGGMLWSNVGMATACVVIGVPIAFTIYFCGPRLRQRSRHATHKR